MERRIKLIQTFILVLIMASSRGFGQELDEKLSALQPFLSHSWSGTLLSLDGTRELTVKRTYEVMTKGKVIKCIKSNEELNNYGEGFFFWNDVEKKIAFFFIESGGVFQNGFVQVENNIITIEGTMTWPNQLNPQVKQSYDFRDIFEFTPEGKMIDKWYQNAFGSWQAGHTIEFEGVSEL